MSAIRMYTRPAPPRGARPARLALWPLIKAQTRFAEIIERHLCRDRQGSRDIGSSA
jgi:hypothetical protein